MTVSRPSSRCQDDPSQPHGPYFQWTSTVNSKTVTKTLSECQLARYQFWFDNAHDLRGLVSELQAVFVQAITEAEDWT